MNGYLATGKVGLKGRWGRDRRRAVRVSGRDYEGRAICLGDEALVRQMVACRGREEWKAHQLHETYGYEGEYQTCISGIAA
jgi:hypothetical protein